MPPPKSRAPGGTGRRSASAPAPAAFDIEAEKLPEGLADKALASGGYPYDHEMGRKDFEVQLEALQIELLKMQAHVQRHGDRIVVLFEGRDSAGKGGCIKRFMEHLNPRHARAVALTKPTPTELGQWYFQRYTSHLPTRGDLVLFDRSWYNRAGVERVMGFANADEVADFLREAPQFEGMLVRDGVRLHKIYLEIGREMQLVRFHERRHDPLKRWKLTPMDLAAIDKWAAYTEALHDNFRFTHTPISPWTVILANDQRRARLEAMRVVLSSYDYEGKDPEVVGSIDRQIVGPGPDMLHRRSNEPPQT
ncbi:MAG: polyphosphate kinase 2 [Hyphomicrobiaceae bacterium]|nr:polyphosphate kinase 2 [Hyphomicrobiaceae bacterium]